MVKRHIYYFDYLRLIAAVSVVYMHVAAGPLRGALNADWHLINVLTSFGFTAVPLFFLMSGYLILSNPKTEDVGVLLKQRIPRLLVPLAGWTVVALIWKFLGHRDFSLSWKELLASFHTPAWIHFWYLYTLLALYLVAPILCAGLRTLDKKGHILVLVLVSLASIREILQLLLPETVDAFLNFDIVSKMTFLGGHLNTFILGYYVGNLKKKIPNWVLLLSGAVVLGVICGGTFHLTAQNGNYNQAFQNQSAGFEILLAMIIFTFFKQNLNRESRFFQFVPVVPLALSMYLMHNILLAMMGTVGIISVATFWDTLFTTFLIFIICFIVMKTVASVKPLCFIATGMSYADACASCNWIYTYRNVKRYFIRKRDDESV